MRLMKKEAQGIDGDSDLTGGCLSARLSSYMRNTISSSLKRPKSTRHANGSPIKNGFPVDGSKVEINNEDDVEDVDRDTYGLQSPTSLKVPGGTKQGGNSKKLNQITSDQVLKTYSSSFGPSQSFNGTGKPGVQ